MKTSKVTFLDFTLNLLSRTTYHLNVGAICMQVPLVVVILKCLTCHPYKVRIIKPLRNLKHPKLCVNRFSCLDAKYKT